MGLGMNGKGLDKMLFLFYFIFLKQCLPGVFDVKRLCFRKDKCEKVTWTGVIWCRRTKLNPNIWMERIRCPEIAGVRRETHCLPIFSGTALLTVDANRDVTVSTGQPSQGFLYCFDIHLCTLSNTWGGKKPITLNPD